MVCFALGAMASAVRGTSGEFQALVQEACPGTLQPSWMQFPNSCRDYDFVEVFSGRAHLSQTMRSVSWHPY